MTLWEPDGTAVGVYRVEARYSACADATGRRDLFRPGREAGSLGKHMRTTSGEGQGDSWVLDGLVFVLLVWVAVLSVIVVWVGFRLMMLSRFVRDHRHVEPEQGAPPSADVRMTSAGPGAKVTPPGWDRAPLIVRSRKVRPGGGGNDGDDLRVGRRDSWS